jgi:hypothetical protein
MEAMASQNYEVSDGGPDYPYIVRSRDGEYTNEWDVLQSALNDAVITARSRKCVVDVFHAMHAVQAERTFSTEVFICQPLYSVVPA